ncbi:MAG: hypothetical protein NVSMB65_08150 [Chloroflexota bacterium]
MCWLALFVEYDSSRAWFLWLGWMIVFVFATRDWSLKLVESHDVVATAPDSPTIHQGYLAIVACAPDQIQPGQERVNASSRFKDA